MQDDQQRVSKLSAEDEARLGEQRQVVERYLAPQSKPNYETAAGKLGLLRALIEQGVFGPTQTYELQCLGIVFGDAFVQELQMQWIMVEDSYGRDPAVQVP